MSGSRRAGVGVGAGVGVAELRPVGEGRPVAELVEAPRRSTRAGVTAERGCCNTRVCMRLPRERAAAVIDDDFDSRPGSTTSLLRTIVGLYLRDLGGWISIAHLVALLELLDVPASSTRMAVTRLKKKGLLTAEDVSGTAGYRIADDALAMLERGDRRIFTPRRMAATDGWCLVSFSIAETERDRRHQLRKRLTGIGCGTVSPALWIAPAYLRDEIEGILDSLDLRGAATLFDSSGERTGTEVAAWWDLDALAALHRLFLAEAQDGASAPAFARYIRGIDAWRGIPYLDPGLPLAVLPTDWPGVKSERLFARLVAECADAAGDVVRASTRPATRGRVRP